MDDNQDARLSRFLEIEKQLRSAGVPHFKTTVTRSHLEIPAPFVRDYGADMNSSASLRLEYGSKVWPLQIQVSFYSRFRVRFSQLWRRFLSDNGLKTGDEVIVSLVGVSEFVIYALKRNLDSRRLSWNAVFNDTGSPSSDDELPDALTPKNTLRTSPLNPSSPGMKVDTHEGNTSNNFHASPVFIDLDKYEDEIAETERSTKIPDDSFNGTISFKKQLSEASTGHFGNPHFARIEIPADFVRRHGKLLRDGTVITLEGPMPGIISQVVCRHELTQSRVMWRRGWPSFVRRNELRKGFNLEFNLVGPSRFSVLLRSSSTHDPSFTMRNANVSRKDRDSAVDEGETSDARPANRPNWSPAVDPHEDPHFFKTISATSVAKLTPYPFLVVPTSFWHNVKLPPQVTLQGPSSDDVFPVKCSGDTKKGVTKNLARGWRVYAITNALEVGDKLRFTYISEISRFLVDYV